MENKKVIKCEIKILNYVQDLYSILTESDYVKNEGIDTHRNLRWRVDKQTSCKIREHIPVTIDCELIRINLENCYEYITKTKKDVEDGLVVLKYEEAATIDEAEYGRHRSVMEKLPSDACISYHAVKHRFSYGPHGIINFCKVRGEGNEAGIDISYIEIELILNEHMDVRYKVFKDLVLEIFGETNLSNRGIDVNDLIITEKSEAKLLRERSETLKKLGSKKFKNFK